MELGIYSFLFREEEEAIRVVSMSRSKGNRGIKSTKKGRKEEVGFGNGRFREEKREYKTPTVNAQRAIEF